MPEAIVDACCFINLYATGDLRGFLTGLAWEWHIPNAALAESLFIRVASGEGDDKRESIEPQPYIDDSLITLVDVGGVDETELYVRLAGDLDVPVVTTPELMERWAKVSKMRPATLKTLLRNIQTSARFAPAEDAPGYDWCTDAIGDASSV